MWPSVFRTQKYEGTQTEKKTLPPAFDMIGILGSLPLGNAKRVEKEKIDILSCIAITFLARVGKELTNLEDSYL